MHSLTRRDALATMVATALAPKIAAAATADLPLEAGLKDHAARAGILYGAAIAEGLDDPDCRALYGREVASITPDTALKFASIRPAPDRFEFAAADAIVDWALGQGMAMRGHTLVWNESNGDWITRCSGREVERIFDEHIDRVVSRYAGRIAVWDVVNEPFWPDHGEPGGYRQGPWYNALGPGYIARALNRVRAVDPGVKLCVNEAHCDSDNAWGRAIRPCLAHLIADLRHDGVPLDAVGLQSHLHPAWPHDYAAFAAYAGLLAQNGVDLHITEFDVDDSSFPDPIGLRDEKVAGAAAAFLTEILRVPQVTAVTNWELADKLSFYERGVLERNPGAKRLPRPLPFDDDLQRKPMWAAIARAFDRRAASRS